MLNKYAWVGLGLVLLAGCYAPVGPKLDALICNSANRPMDAQPATLPDAAPSSQNPPVLDKTAASSKAIKPRPDSSFDELLLVSAQDKQDKVDQPKGPTLLDRLQVPKTLQGADDRAH